MPFDGIDAPPEWRRARGGGGDDDVEPAWTARDRLVAGGIALVLSVITVGECRMLLGYWLGMSHGG